MKRILFLTFLFCSLIARAQIGEYRNDMCIGVNAGVTLNEVGFDPLIAQNYHTSPTMGITFRYTSEKFLTAYCAFQAELNYARLGWNENIVDANLVPLPDTYKRNIDYLQMPFFARLAWGKEKKGFMFYFLVGPQIGFMINESEERSSQWTLNANGTPNRPNGVTEQYNLKVKNKFDYGISGGIGVELTTSCGHFLVEGRYYYGLADIFGNAKRDFFSRSNHSTIIAKVSYLIDIN